MPSGGMSASSSTYNSNPAYDRISSIPSWLPPQGLTELQNEYANTNNMYSTEAYDRASTAQQGRVLTTAMNAGSNAAADYANRARQAGGSGLGAGLVKAQAQTGARATAGAMELERQKFDADQKDKAATHAGQIAQALGSLRSSYLNSIISYATQEDAISTTRRGQDEQARQFNFSQPTGGGYTTDAGGNISSLYGTPFRNESTGLPTSNTASAPTNRGFPWWGG